MRSAKEGLSPPAPRAPQSRCAAESSFGRFCRDEAKGGVADAEPTGDPGLQGSAGREEVRDEQHL